MKNLSNCTNTEFLKQATLIRQPLKAWLERTGIPAIRKRRPEGFDDMTEEEKIEAMKRQARENMPEIIDAALQKDFDRTIELLCLVTFTGPEHFDDNPLPDYIYAVNEMMNSPRVVDFFTLYL